jgi:hypothetical protein
MGISDELSDEISLILNDYLTGTLTEKLGLRLIASKINALPLYVDMGGVFAIRANGEIVSISWDEEQVVVVEDERVRNVVLFQGSRRYPRLVGLAPIKTQNSHVCPYCHGSGTDPVSANLGLDNIVCYCGGLGWIP